MVAHNARAFALLIGHGAMLVALSQKGTQTIQAMRARQDAPSLVIETYQTFAWMSVGVAVLLLSAFLSLSDEPRRYQRALLWISFAGFIVELAEASRIWVILIYR
jgi:hypothetical protein